MKEFKGFLQFFALKSILSIAKLSLVAMLFLFGFAPETYAQDADGDGYADTVDLDADNDGVTDLTECASSPCGTMILGGMTGDINIYEVVSDTCSYTDGGNVPLNNCNDVFNPSNLNNANWINNFVTGSNTCLPSDATYAVNQTSTSASSTLICDPHSINNIPGSVGPTNLLADIFTGVDANGLPHVPQGDHNGYGVSNVAQCTSTTISLTDAPTTNSPCSTAVTTQNQSDWIIADGFIVFPPTPSGVITLRNSNVGPDGAKANYTALMVSSDDNPANAFFVGEAQTKNGVDLEIDLDIDVAVGTVPAFATPCSEIRYFKFFLFDPNAQFAGSLQWSLDGGSTFTNIPTQFLSTVNPLTTFDYTTCDTDSDGIPDYLDLDSDDDGCVDALEGDGGFDYVDIQNDTLTGGVDTDGIPNVAMGGQGRGDGINAAIQSCDACNSISPIFTDNDLDGIGDVCDLDDDNDGILDVDEMKPTIGVDSDSDGIDDAHDSDCDGVSTNIPSGNVSAVVFENSIGSSGNIIGSDDSRAIMNQTNDEMVLDLGIVVPSGTIIEVEALTNAGGVGQPLRVTQSNDNSTFTNSQNISFNETEATKNYTLTADAQYIKLFRSNNTGAIFIDNVLYQAHTYIPCNGYVYSALDADGDGTPDYLDLDADDDGCPDALEGDGGFTYAQITNDTLIGGVDTLGIPALATNTGQATGTSVDSTIVGAACTTMAENDINQTPQDTDVSGNILTNDTDPTGDNQTVQSATFLNAGGMETNLPLGAPTDIYDEAGTLAGSITLNADGTYDFTPATGYTGEVPVEYIVVDDNGSTDTASLSIEVLPTPSTDGSNNDVIAQDDTNTTEQGETVTTPLLANDSDPDADPLSVTAASGLDDTGSPVALTTTPQDIYDENGVLAGQASLDANGNVIFTADNDFIGDVPVNYTATDGTDTDDAVLVITVEPADSNDNDTYANDDASTGIQGADQTGNMITNDNDPEAEDQDIQSILVDTDNDGNAEVITPVAGSPVDVYQDGVLIGTVDVDPETGDFTFAPEADFVGTAVIPYTTTDGVDTDDATLYVTVLPNENTTVAENDINQTPQDTPVGGNVLTNDTDEEGDNQTVQSATFLNAGGMETNLPLGAPTDIYDEAGTLAGSITLNADGSYDFTPATGYTGEVPVEYVVVDDNGNPVTDAATLSIEVMSIDDPEQNDPPVANDDTNTTEMDTDVSGNVIDPNDSDPDGDALTVAAILADTDGDGVADDPVTLSAPTSIYGINEVGDTVVAGTITLHASGIYTFDPAPTFTGEVPVDYTISDGNGGTDDATLTIAVEPDNGNATFANDDTNSGDMGEDQSGNMLTNDNDPEADDQDVASILVDTDGDGTPEVVTPVAGVPTPVYQDGVLIGEITVSPTAGSYDWNPEDTFVGTAVIPYTTTDNNGATDTATLYLTTLPVNTIASTDDFNNTPYETPVSADVSTNDVDEEGDNQTFTLDGLHGGLDTINVGTVIMNPDGSYTFTPVNGFSGETEFTYAVCDDGTPALCDTATVYMEVLEPITATSNQVIANLDANTVNQDSIGTGNVLANDLDPDDLSPAVTTPLTNQTVAGVDEDGNPVVNAGTLTLNTDGSYTFEPAPGFTGTVIQEYAICDGGTPAIACDTTELIIDVIPSLGNSTFANDDAVMTDAGVMVSGDVAANDADNENDTQTINSFSYDTDGDGDSDLTVLSAGLGSPVAVGGTDDEGNFVANAGDLTLNADGTYDFEPASGFAGNVVIPYETCDDGMPQACEAATLVITVLDVKRDYGDAPALYPVAWHRKMTDTNEDNVLDGATDVWLGTNTDFETAQASSALADGDTNDDAMTFGTGTGQFPMAVAPGQTFDVHITVNSTVADIVHYGMWIDWDEDGTYDNFYGGSRATASPADAIVTVTAPSSIGATTNVRLRVDDEPLFSGDFEGGKSNGEVEDYQAMVVLPVELVSFTSTMEDCDVALEWVSASEENFSHYVVQKSTNGLKFETIGLLEGTANSYTTRRYQYVDKSVVGQVYYRLVMLDLDGTFDYSSVLTERSDCNSVNELTVYPNPVGTNQGMLNVILEPSQSEVQIEIYNMLGQVVKATAFELEAAIENSIQLDVSELPSGRYTIYVKGDRTSASFIIQD